MAWFPDGPGGDQFEEKEFRGPLSIILSEAIGYIERNYLNETVVKYPHKPEAERFWNFPIGAIEEAGLKLKDRPHFLASHLKPALKAGLMEMTLPNKPTSRHQRYRRTAAGEALAEQIERRNTGK